MDYCFLLLLSCTILTSLAWSVPFYPMRVPLRMIRHAPPPLTQHLHHHRIPVRDSEDTPQRPKRDHEYDHDNYKPDHGGYKHDHSRATSGVTGPVHTFVKTDKNANYKWGVRHHVGNKYAA